MTITQAQLNAEIITNLPTTGSGAITAAITRQTLTDMTTAIFQSANVLNVKSFGAVGNGIADDYPAFATASTALSAAGGGALFVPAGNFNCISGTIKPPSNTVLQGAGIDATIISNNVQTFPDDQTISIYGTMTGPNTGWPGSNTTYPINAPTLGTNTVTTTSAVDAGNFPIGTIIFISGGLHSTSFWYPGWFTTVKATNAGTGIITLDETLPFGGSQITTVQKILSLKQNIAIRDMTISAGKASAIGCFVAKNILVDNVKCIPGASGVATGPSAALGVCRNSMFRSCHMEQGFGPLELFVASDSYIEGCHLINSNILVDGGSFDCGVINNYIKDPMQQGIGTNAITIAEYNQRISVIGNKITGVPDNFAGVFCPVSPDANRFYSIIGNHISGVPFISGNLGVSGAFSVCVGNHFANLKFGINPDNNAPAFIDSNTFDNVTQHLPNDGLTGSNTTWRSRAAGGVKAMTTATATPSVVGVGAYQLFNASPQTITDFTGAEIGDEITITFGDGNTTLQASGNLQTAAQVNYNPPANTVMSFVRMGAANWQERSRSSLYPTGLGSVTQLTNKSTSVTLNTNAGVITMNNAALLSGVTVGFTVNNSTVGSTDVVIVSIASGATANSYRVEVDAVVSQSFHVSLTNYSGGSLSEAVVLNFAVIKWVNR